MDHSDCIAVERTAARLALRHQCFQPVRQRLDGAQSDRPCRALEAVDPAIRFGEVEPRRIVACGRQIAQQGSDGLQMIPVFDPERRYQSLLDGAHTRYLSTAFCNWLLSAASVDAARPTSLLPVAICSQIGRAHV